MIKIEKQLKHEVLEAKIEDIQDVNELEQYWLKLGCELGCAPNEVGAYPVIRYSAAKQGQGTSVERQINRIREACQIRGWLFDEKRIRKDLGVSAFKEANFRDDAGLGGLLLEAQRGLLLPYAIAIFENIDRFSRAEIDRADSKLWSLVKAGCAVLFVSNGLLLKKGDENDITKRMILLFEFNRAHEESKRKSMLLLAAVKYKLARAAKGEKVNMGPWKPKWLTYIPTPGNPHYVEDDDTAKVARHVVEVFLKTKRYHTAAVQLNAEKVHTFGSGKMWHGITVKKFVINPVLIGTAKFSKVAFQNFYPPLISESDWLQIQALSVPRRAGGGTPAGYKINTLFPGLATCNCCDQSMVVSSSTDQQKAKRYHYYTCRSSLFTSGCTNGRLRTTAVELDFFADYLAKSPAEAIISKDREVQDKAAKLRVKIAGLNQKISTLTKMDTELGYDELKLELKKSHLARCDAQKELEALFESVNSMMTAEHVWREIVREVTGLDEIIVDGKLSAAAVKKLQQLNHSGLNIQSQLANQETRRRISALMPSMIAGIVIDASKHRYAVRTIDGQVGAWRDLTPILTAMELSSQEVKREQLKVYRRRYWDSLTPDQRRDATEELRAGLRKYHKAAKAARIAANSAGSK